MATGVLALPRVIKREAPIYNSATGVRLTAGMSSSSAHPPNIFDGARFWLSREVPQRSRFKDLITKHGGQIVLMENDANIKLVDHIKKNIPAGCYSYQYVEASIRRGEPADLEAHRAGPSKPRAMGASNIPRKSTRSIFTLEDDQLLYDFLYPFEQEGNAPIHGNKIYQLLEQRFPKHTWQSSRSRYLKKLRGQPRPGGGSPRPLGNLMPAKSQAKPQAEASTRTMPSKPATPSTQTTAPAPTVPSIQKTSTQTQPSSSTDHLEKQLNPKRKLRDSHESPSEPRASPSKRRTITRSPHTHTPQESPRQPLKPIIRPPASVTPIPASEEKDEPSINETLRDEVDMLFLELPFLLPAPESTDELEASDEGNDDQISESGDNDLVSWVESQVSRGVDDAVIDDALCCTNLNCELAEKILDILAAGNPIPDDIPGVWTSKDDDDLQGPNGRGVERVAQKHGERSLEERWKYLSEARERDMI